MRTIRRTPIRGGALAEMAILMPLLMLLLLGSAQVGALMYGNITVATAAREGAFTAAQKPNGSLAFTNGSANSQPYPTCPSGSTNPVCLAVWNSSGLLNGQQTFSVVISPIAASGPPAWAASCPVTSPLTVQDGYVTVAVSYNVPIFTPMVGRILATPGQSYRTVTSSVTDRVFRCTMTSGR